jgi:hypothetical protein
VWTCRQWARQTLAPKAGIDEFSLREISQRRMLPFTARAIAAR